MVCNICSSNNIKFSFFSSNIHGRNKLSPERFSIYQCKDCGMIFLGKTNLNKKFYQKYYDRNYFSQTNNKVSFASRLTEFFSYLSTKKKERLILKNINNMNKVSIIDIGCGDGKFLEKLNPKKFEKFGLEINLQAVENCKKKNISMFDKPLTSLDFKNKKFDAITLWHSFEHMENPLETFHKIKKVLSKNGVLILQTPNTKSLGFRFGKENWFHLDSPRHLFIYTEKAIDKLCQKTGFTLVKSISEFYDYPLDLFWSIRYSPVKYLFYPLYPMIKFFDREHLTYFIKINIKAEKHRK